MTTTASVRSGPAAGFKDYVRYRKAQGYNWVNIIAAFPNWMTDGQPWHVVMNDPEHTTVRSAWLEFGTGDPRTGSAKNMDNEGGRPFLFPGKVPGYENMFPDVDRINPEYFRYVDRKIDYLNEQGFVPFIEVSRRDASLCGRSIYGWPDSYARFIQYIWSRYQANNTVLSPIHLDIISESVGPDDYLAAIGVVMEKFGPPPFGTLLSANANPSTLENWGEDSWVTLHQTGNMREHNNYWYLTEIFNQAHPQPALNGEPYYSGYVDARGQGGGGYKFGAPGGTEKDDQFVRSAMYGSFLSGRLRRARLRRRRHLGRRHRAGRADQDVGRLPVELRKPDAAPAHVRLLHRQALPGTGSAGRPGLAQQDPRHPLLRGLGLLRAHARQEHLPGLFREGLSAQPGARGQAEQHLSRGVVRSAQRYVAGRAGGGTLRSSVIGIIMLPDFPGDMTGACASPMWAPRARRTIGGRVRARRA